MTTSIRSALWALALLVPGGTSAWAGGPATPPASGHVLVLDNEHTLEGDVDRVGDQYRIRRGNGETWVPAVKVLRLCTDEQGAYAYLRSRANLDDPDERLRLAQWCHVHELPAQALREVQAAAELRPDHGPTKWLLAKLQEAGTSHPAPSSARPDDPAENSAAPPIDLNTEALAQFVTRVQPILMNACINCHGGNYAGTFKLMRVHDIGSASRRALQQNMAAVIEQMNFDRPASSALLIKAVTAHGAMTQPLFKSQEAPAYRVLDDWVQKTVAAHPQLRERGAKASLVVASRGETVGATEPKPALEHAVEPKATAVKEQFGVASSHAATTGQPESPVILPAAPQAAPQQGASRAIPLDEFDPQIFNRQMHPQKKGS